ncbi:hypothetical protein ACB094_09G112600 [Castanea mollissima]
MVADIVLGNPGTIDHAPFVVKRTRRKKPGLCLSKILKHKVQQCMVLINPIMATIPLKHIIRKLHHHKCSLVVLAVHMVEIINFPQGRLMEHAEHLLRISP